MSDDDGSEQSSRAGNAAKTAAKTGAKKGGKSLGKKLVLILGIKGIVIALVIGLCLLVIAAAAAAVTGQQAAAQPVNAGCGAPTPAGSASGTAPGVTAEQNANATAIITVALGLGLGYRGALIGVLTADVESDLVNVTFGDMTGPGGSMSSSRGSVPATQRLGQPCRPDGPGQVGDHVLHRRGRWPAGTHAGPRLADDGPRCGNAGRAG